MLEAMKKARGILDKLGITSWLDCGTLLWMYRNKTPDMSDCDMSIYEKDTDKLLGGLNEFLRDGFSLYKIFRHPLKGVTEISMFYNNHKIDLFIKFYNKGWGYSIATRPKDGSQFVFKAPKRHYYPLTLYTLDTLEAISLGEPYYWKIPNDIESYLETYYGKDWRIPAKKWDWQTDAPCIDLDWKIK